jgi:hypothetical protein
MIAVARFNDFVPVLVHKTVRERLRSAHKWVVAPV